MAPGSAWRALFEMPLQTADPGMAGLLAEEEQRQASAVNLIASESYCPRATIEAEVKSTTNLVGVGSIFAFGLVAFGFLCMGPVNIAVDSYGPVTDNAQSVFELAQTEHIPGIKE